jgi:hypothetical protein
VPTVDSFLVCFILVPDLPDGLPNHCFHKSGGSRSVEAYIFVLPLFSRIQAIFRAITYYFAIQYFHTFFSRKAQRTAPHYYIKKRKDGWSPRGTPIQSASYSSQTHTSIKRSVRTLKKQLQPSNSGIRTS